jgi:hypothetical protein
MFWIFLETYLVRCDVQNVKVINYNKKVKTKLKMHIYKLYKLQLIAVVRYSFKKFIIRNSINCILKMVA